MRIRNKIIALFCMLTGLFSVSSCHEGGLRRGDDYNTMWDYFEDRNITPLECKDYVLFEEKEKSVVIRRSDDYRIIKEIRTFPSVAQTRETFAFYFAGMSVFEIVEHFGIPDKIQSTPPFFRYRLSESDVFKIPFYCDDLHLYHAM